MMKKLVGRLAWAFLVTAVAVPAFAQSAGSVRGTVVDSSGAVVPGVVVVLTSETTKFAQEQVSSANGRHLLRRRHAGPVHGQGHARRLQGAIETKGLRVSANDTLSIEVKLEVGVAGEVVEVRADRASDPDEHRRPRRPDHARADREPLDRRPQPPRAHPHPARRRGSEPGLVRDGWYQIRVRRGRGASFSINGARAENLGITLDGANLRDIGDNSSMMNVPNNEFVSEVKVQTSNYAAEFGSSTISVQAITKAGSSEFHGSALLLRTALPVGGQRSLAQLRAVRRDPRASSSIPASRCPVPSSSRARASTRTGTRRSSSSATSGRSRHVDTGSVQAVVPTTDMRNGNFATYLGGQNLDSREHAQHPLRLPECRTARSGP